MKQHKEETMKRNHYYKDDIMNQKHHLKQSLIILVVLTCLGVTSAWGIPQLINYQGVLKDTSGVPVVGPVNMTFKIYDVETGGSLLWTEDHTGVQLDNGIYNVLLGSNTILPVNIFSDDDRWLEMTVNTEVLIPRTKITSAAFNFRADNADYAATAGDAGTAESVPWSGITNRPSGLDDGDDVGITTESDPTVLSSVKDGISWSEVSNRPSGLDDGDDVGITTESDPTVQANVKDGVSWSEVTAMPAGFADGVDNEGLSTSSDYGRSGVAPNLYEGTTMLSNKYLGKTAKAADSDKLDGYHASNFSTGSHVSSVNGLSGGTISSSVTVSGTSSCDKVYVGNAGNNNAVQVYNNSSSYPTIYAQNNGNNNGLAAYSNNYTALYAQNNSSSWTTAYFYNPASTALRVDCGSSSSYAAGIYGANSSSPGLYVQGYIYATGGTSSLVQAPDGTTKAIYSVQAPDTELHFSGSASLDNGIAIVEFEEEYKSIISPEIEVKVIVTLTEECNGIFVSEKFSNGFTVKELRRGKSDASFDWIAIARRKDYKLKPTITSEMINPSIKGGFSQAIEGGVSETSTAK